MFQFILCIYFLVCRHNTAGADIFTACNSLKHCLPRRLWRNWYAAASILSYKLFVPILLFGLCSCYYESFPYLEGTPIVKASYLPDLTGFQRYDIKKGEHQSLPKGLKIINLSELRFEVLFDSSAIYNTQNPENQADVNKLYGFSDNNAPHSQFSARVGWRWYNNKLWLMAFVHNDGVFDFKEIGTIKIAQKNNCSIKVSGPQYLFTLNDTVQVSMPRHSHTKTAIGYSLYPYFGGDEAAPHPIYVWIREW